MDMKLVEVQATYIREMLRTMADPAREPGVQRFFKDRVKSLGIGTPALRKLSQEYLKDRRKSLGLDGTLAIGDRLIRCELLEEKAMAVLLAERFAGRLQPAHVAVFDRWIDYADNWAVIDGICCPGPAMAISGAGERQRCRWWCPPDGECTWTRRSELPIG